jgi:CRP-like cAMP-binding protein
MQSSFEMFIYNRLKNPNIVEIQEILSVFSEKKYLKGEIFKAEGSVQHELGFLVEGSSRSYFINEKGDEITDGVLQSNNFLADIVSIRTKEKSPYIIELLENSLMFTAPMNEVWNLLEKNISFNILMREYMGERAMELVKRYFLFLNGSAKERYEYLISSNPTLLQKYPLKYVASMIGVTPTQLSRIRNERN